MTLPIAKNKKVDSNTKTGNTSVDFYSLNYTEQSRGGSRVRLIR